MKGNEDVGGRKNDTRLERIKSNVHSDNITKNVLHVNCGANHSAKHRVQGILNDSSPLGPYTFVYGVTLVGGRMGGWTVL